MSSNLLKILDPLRKLSHSEGRYELSQHYQTVRHSDNAFFDELAVALADGKLASFDEPLHKQSFCSQDMYGLLSQNARYGRVQESRVFAQGLDHAKRRIRTYCVAGLIHFPAEARRAARRRLDSPNAGTREAAVRVLQGIRDKASQQDLTTMLASEKSKAVIKALEETLAGFGALPKTTRLLPKPKPPRFAGVAPSGDPEVLQRIRAYFSHRSGTLIATEHLAAALGITPEQAEAEMLAVQAADKDLKAITWIRAHQVGWIRWGAESPWKYVKAPKPDEVDAYVAAADYRGLDKLLASAGRKPPDGLGKGAPPLKYRDGSKMSAGAQAWFIAELFEYGGVLVRAAIDDECCGELASWLADKKLPHRNTMALVGNEAFANDVGDRYVRRKLKRAHLRGWSAGPVAQARWSMRMWRTIANWNARVSVVDIDSLEESFPHGADPSGSDAQWRRWIAECLEQAMAGERVWDMARFRRRYLDNPLARRAAEGVAFEYGVYVGDGFESRGFFKLEGEGFVSAEGPVHLPGTCWVRVAHPARGIEGWPECVAPFPQRERGPVPTTLEVPAEPVDGTVWARRLLTQWIQNGTPDRDDHFRYLRHDHKVYGELNVEFHHTGYYQDHPLRLTRINLDRLATLWSRDGGCDQERWMRLSPVLRCEIARDLRAMCAPSVQPTSAPGQATALGSSAKPKSAGAPEPKAAPGPAKSGSGGPTLELAKSARSKCRVCRKTIDKGDWRLGDPYLVPGSSSGRTAMSWWHLECALQRNKQALVRALDAAEDFPDQDAWRMKL